MSLPVPGTDFVIAGKYRVLRVLGEGGMGTVFEAEHVRTHKRVAVKGLKASDDDSALRLLREAQAAARVRHPNVVDVYDVAQEGDAVFLVMEYLEGEPLSALLERGGLPPHALIALLLPALRGAAAAHKQGVVHRDIKPDNIFLARVADTLEPVPKLLDFGISKLEPRGGEQLALTGEGTAMGTPMYMSYEQLRGESDVDARTDVYAFGVVLYEALTGRAPFEAETISELAIKIATSDAVPLAELCPRLPHALVQAVGRAMARDRGERTPTVDALLAALAPFASARGFDDPSPPAPVGSTARPARGRGWLALWAVLGIALALALARLTRQREARAPLPWRALDRVPTSASTAPLAPRAPSLPVSTLRSRAEEARSASVGSATDAATVQPAPAAASAGSSRRRVKPRTQATTPSAAHEASAPQGLGEVAPGPLAPTPPGPPDVSRVVPASPAKKFRATPEAPRAEDF